MAATVCLAALCGCVTVYQPLVSLQRPVVVDPGIANFAGQRVLLRCIPGDYLSPRDSETLCRQLQTLFGRQGAQVDVEVSQGGMSFGREAGGPKPDLVIDLKARLLHEDMSAVLWIASVMTFTLVPMMSETTFAQDITIRDGAGFQLATDSLQARFVRYIGLGVWAVNGVLDLTVRTEADQVMGDAASKQFSRDFYGQLSQLAFHARMRALVMRGFEPAPPPGTTTLPTPPPRK